MPHFIIHCSAEILEPQSEEQLIEQLHTVATDSELFKERDIKVRLQPFTRYSAGNERLPFLHVFASIMQGRTDEQKSALSRAVVAKLLTLFPDTPNIAMNVSEFEKASYCNRDML